MSAKARPTTLLTLGVSVTSSAAFHSRSPYRLCRSARASILRQVAATRSPSAKFRHQLSARRRHLAVAKVFAVPRMSGPVSLRQQSRSTFEAEIKRALHALLLGVY